MYLHENFQVPQLIEAGFLSIIKQNKMINQNNVNNLYQENRTALHIAIITGQIQIALYLLQEFKLDLTLLDSIGFTVIDWIRIKSQLNPILYQPLVKLLPQYTLFHKQQLKDIKQIANTYKHKLTIFRAAQLGLKQLEQSFHNMNPFIKDQFGRKALHYAALAGNQQTFLYLIDKKFDPLCQDNYGFNSYHYICVNPLNLLNKYIRLQQLSKSKFIKENNSQFVKQDNYYDVIIIGSGASGIGAGMTLTRKGLSYLVLQARDRIGGRILSTKVNDVEVDLGACWVHSYSKNNPICKEVNNLKWKSSKSQNRTDAIILSQLKGQISEKDMNQCRLLYLNYFAAVQQKANKLEQDVSIQQAGKVFYQKCINTLPPYKKAIVDMFINMSEQYNAASVSQLSAKHYDDQEDVGGDFTPEGSYSALLTDIAESFQITQRVKFNTEVTEINYHNQNNQKQKQNNKNQYLYQYCQIKCKNGQTYYCKKIISSIPLGVLKQHKIKFVPQLPQLYNQIINKLGFGVMNKIIVSFQSPFWKNNPSWIRLACQQKGKFSSTYNFSSMDNQKYILCFFVTDNFASKISKLSNEQIMEDLIQLLKKSFNKKQIHVKDYVITQWNEDQYALGSYSHFSKDTNMQTVKQLRKNINERLWIVGQHCYGEHIGCAHGAFQTGIWAADEILSLIKRITLLKE